MARRQRTRRKRTPTGRPARGRRRPRPPAHSLRPLINNEELIISPRPTAHSAVCRDASARRGSEESAASSAASVASVARSLWEGGREGLRRVFRAPRGDEGGAETANTAECRRIRREAAESVSSRALVGFCFQGLAPSYFRFRGPVFFFFSASRATSQEASCRPSSSAPICDATLPMAGQRRASPVSSASLSDLHGTSFSHSRGERRPSARLEPLQVSPPHMHLGQSPAISGNLQ